ncbi:MAG: hypothetical protein R3213_08585, partial [Flavobacteriaceae bacterium]|nr:hypothetical protein [Flavobacteriaceae bacterium]
SKDLKGYVCGEADDGLVIKNFNFPYFENAIRHGFYQAREEQPNIFIGNYDKQTKDEFYKILFEQTELQQISALGKTEILETESLTLTIVPSDHFMISIVDLKDQKLTEEEIGIVRKFSNVFKQSYTRFLDLKKAEAQAREAQIEAALERVRSRTMGMQKSEELSEVAKVLFDQFSTLGNIPNRMSIGIIQEHSNSLEWWITDQNGKLLEQSYSTSTEESKPIESVYFAWKAGKESLKIELEGKELKEWLKYIKHNVEMPLDTSQVKGKRIHQGAFFSKGLLLITSHEPIADEIFKILIRFAKVFDQTYTRFLDLKKAEAQAREAQIEMGLERVRAQAMAMHKSQELHEVIKVVGEQLLALNLQFDSCNFLQVQDDGSWDAWILTPAQPYPKKLHIPFIDHVSITSVNKIIEEGGEFHKDILSKKDKNIFFNHFFTNTLASEIPQERKDYVFDRPAWVRSIFIMKNISLVVTNYLGVPFSDTDNEIFMRFKKVFEQAYIRFLDLQKAEAQAREAQIEAALERVRSKSMAMHDSKDLHGVVTLVYEQLEVIGLKMNSVLLHERILDSKNQYFWVAANGQVYSQQTVLPITNHSYFTRFKKAQANGESFYSKQWSKAEKDRFFKHYFTKSIHSEVPQERKDYIYSCEGMNQSIALQQHTAISVLRYDTISYSDEENETIKRFAQVFEQSYRRYLDLKRAEEQTREAQIEAALERVRSKAMAMRDSVDIGESITILFEEINNLGFQILRIGIGIMNGHKSMDVWTTTTSEGKKVVEISGTLEMDIHPSLEMVYAAWEENETHASYKLEGTDAEQYYKAISQQRNYSLPDSD